jgi:adenylate cyclase
MNWKKIKDVAGGSILGVMIGVGLGALLMLDVGAALRLEKLGKFFGRLGSVGDRIGKAAQHLSYDLVFPFRSYRIPQEVVIVYMDEESHERLQQPYDRPWDRGMHAKLLQRLKDEGAKAVVYDILFAGRLTNNLAGDEAFARAIKDFGKVVLAAEWLRVEETGKGQDVVGSKTELPDELFMEGAAGVGTAEMNPDPDFLIRRHFPGSPGELVSSLSWTAAEVLELPIAKDESQKFKSRWVNYYAPPRKVPSISFWRTVISDERERVAPGFFKDKVVFIGAGTRTKFSGERKDEYKNPFSAWTTEKQQIYMPGVEVQATVLLNLIRGDWLRRVPFLTDLWLVLLSGLIFGILLPLLKPLNSAIVGLISMVVITAAGYYLFKTQQLWFSWFIIAGVGIPHVGVFSIVYNSIRLHVQKKLVEQSLSMYVSPSRVKQILKNPEILKPGAEKQELSILFSDIADFTSISEGMDSDELANLMNNYFETTVGQCLDPASGTVVKFIGDAIFAIWNAPETQADHQELACKAALLLRNHATAFTFRPGVEIRTRVGLHCGVANVGNFGSSRRVDYTALGENINLASRMEGLNKHLGTDVLITDSIYSAVASKYVTRFCGRFQLKGFERAVGVYELVGGPDQAEPTRTWREAYEKAIQNFQKGDLNAAEESFHCMLKVRPNDGPSRFFLKTIQDLRDHPREGEWSDIVELKEK